jgi:hypothetical protein
MTNELIQQEGHSDGDNKLPLTIQGKQFKWDEQYITGAQIKELGQLPGDSELFLSIGDPWRDELVTDLDKVDLARPGLEQFFIKKNLKYTINGKEFETGKQYIRGLQIRKQGEIKEGDLIFLAVERPWDDELITDEEWVDLARPGKEHFISKEDKCDIIIIVNGREKIWKEKIISFEQVVVLAFENYVDNGRTIYTVTYKRGPQQNPEGSMVKGDIVHVKNKMIFNATATDKS